MRSWIWTVLYCIYGKLIFSCDEGRFRTRNGYCSECFQTCYSCRGNQQCHVCPNSCFNCDTECPANSGCNRVDCSSCPDGYFLYTYSQNKGYCRVCNNPGCKCTTYYECNECRPGRYDVQNKCVDTCVENCKECSDPHSCEVCIDGKFGQTCQGTCSQNCKTLTCDKNSGRCTDGCKDGQFWNGNDCEGCPQRCIACDSSTTCTQCQEGFWGKACQYQCIFCNHYGCNRQNICNKGCKDGYYFGNSNGFSNCYRCPYTCKTCTNSSYCDVCVSGYWGNYCQYSCGGCLSSCSKEAGCAACRAGYYSLPKCLACSVNCMNNICDSDNGHCTDGCMDGSYGDTCTLSCLSTCKTCTNSYRCTSCKGSFYGGKCDKKCLAGCESCINGHSCNSCKDGFYNKDAMAKCECSLAECSSERNGICNSCKQSSTWYPVDNYCCPCASSCKNDVCYGNGTCVECPSTRYGELCTEKCSTRCSGSICERNGDCVQCPTEFFGRVCEHTCSEYNSRCSRCTGKAILQFMCTECQQDYYPENNKCTKCNNGCLTSTNVPICYPNNGTCIYGCRQEWLGAKCDTKCGVSDCKTCQFDNLDQCFECNDGFYSANSSFCQSCPINCNVSALCNKSTGFCLGCKENWSGEECEIPCPTSCFTCEQGNYEECVLCTANRYGRSCENNCSDTCVRSKNELTCDKTSGECLLGCLDGHWGDTCSSHCGKGCSGVICNRTSGFCLSNCDKIYYGNACDKICSKTCNETPFNNRTCHFVSGECLVGCKTGYYGAKCTEICNTNCNGSSCYRENGTCTHGCTGDFTGPTCAQALTDDTPVKSNIVVTAVATVGGILVAILMAIAVVFYIRRRRSSSKLQGHDDGKQDSTRENTGLEYSSIDDIHPVTEDNQVRGVANNVYANASVRMSDISEKNEVTNSNTLLAMPASEDYLKEVEIDEDVKGDDDKAEAIAKVDDTYYNIGGQRVAVTKLAEYIKYKPPQDFLNDFEKIPKGLLKSFKEAKKAKNTTKNKYRAIYPCKSIIFANR